MPRGAPGGCGQLGAPGSIVGPRPVQLGLGTAPPPPPLIRPPAAVICHPLSRLQVLEKERIVDKVRVRVGVRLTVAVRVTVRIRVRSPNPNPNPNPNTLTP